MHNNIYKSLKVIRNSTPEYLLADLKTFTNKGWEFIDSIQDSGPYAQQRYWIQLGHILPNQE